MLRALNCLNLMTAKAIKTISAIPPTTPPAIAAITPAACLGSDGEVGLARSITSESPTPNVEKCVTTNVHIHWPLLTEPMQRDISSGDDDRLPALASDIANPCTNHYFSNFVPLSAPTFMFDVAFIHLSVGTSTASVSVMPPDRASIMPLGFIEMRGLRNLPEENRVENEPA